MAAKEAWAKKRRSKPSLHIDLYNFEDSKYEGSKYVLTSPRSLDACSALGIKVSNISIIVLKLLLLSRYHAYCLVLPASEHVRYNLR